MAFAAAAAAAVVAAVAAVVAASAVVVAVDGIDSSEPGLFVIVAAVDVLSAIVAADLRTCFGVTEPMAIAAAVVRVEPAFDSVGVGMMVNWGPTFASAIAAASMCFASYQLVHFGPVQIAEDS